MNTRTKKPSTLCAALGGAGLARTGAMLALALGAAQAGAATTYTVPLQFNITLAAPQCSLTVAGQTASSTLTTAATAEVDLITNPVAAPSAAESPTSIAGKIVGNTLSADAQGQKNTTAAIKKVLTGAHAASGSVTCTAGTPMTVRITKGSAAVTSTNAGLLPTEYMAGAPTVPGQPTFLPIGMVMGIWSLAGATSATDAYGVWGETTYGSGTPTVSQTATGSAQILYLTPAVYATSGAALNSNYAGKWIYPFNVNLDF